MILVLLVGLRNILGSSDSTNVWMREWEEKGKEIRHSRVKTLWMSQKGIKDPPHKTHKCMWLFFLFFTIGYIMNYFYSYKENNYKKFFPVWWQMPVLDMYISPNHCVSLPVLTSAPVHSFYVWLFLCYEIY